jgi:hypothetical protein
MRAWLVVCYSVSLTIAVLAQLAEAVSVAGLIRAASMPLLGAALAMEIRRQP